MLPAWRDEPGCCGRKRHRNDDRDGIGREGLGFRARRDRITTSAGASRAENDITIKGTHISSTNGVLLMPDPTS